MKTIAVLMTCHNRKFTTTACLKSLFSCHLPSNHEFNVFLVDDGSKDGTTNAVKEGFPVVNVIQGNGNLFWNQGMLLAWETAIKTKSYDYYLWLNDDTILDGDALTELLETEAEIYSNVHQQVVLCGACRASNESSIFSYGGRNDSGPVIPNGQLQTCKYMNGNAVLVPVDIFDVIGTLSAEYTHVWGDLDYGLRAQKAGFYCYTSKTYLATCPPNQGIPAWCNPQSSIKLRWKLLHSPKGLNIREYIIYRKKFWGSKWIIFALKAYIKALFPKTYAYISN